ncbi:solute carrier family 2, facilitated glucose transporter member 4-like [Mixophyes fleayi]|uniref:solute carrier family 2, facilitated glucose transporter member 4-like n=1 Tax=Mixophyes fleayi TaxID=3061075 RepID=UPI003F4E3BB2
MNSVYFPPILQCFVVRYRQCFALWRISICPACFTAGKTLQEVSSFESVLGTEKWWLRVLNISAVSAFLQFLTLPVCPESPCYLFSNCKIEEDARKGYNKMASVMKLHYSPDDDGRLPELRTDPCAVGRKRKRLQSPSDMLHSRDVQR